MKVIRIVGAIVAAAMLGATPLARASFIQVPDIGGRDSGLCGNDVATPLDGPGILLNNAAGMVDRKGTYLDYSFLVAISNAQYADRAKGYDTKSSETPLLPTLWIASDRWKPWTFGFGLYGSVGASFNFPGNPAIGIPNRFFSELTIIQLGLLAGREVLPGLRIAFQPAPTYGRLRVHFPSPLGPVSYDVDGFGMAGSFGALYDLVPGTTLGVSYRSQGIVYLRGDGDIGGAGEDVDADLHTPQSVVFGVAQNLTDHLLLSTQVRWSDYSKFEESSVTFHRTKALNGRLFGATRDTFRYGAGLDYEASEWAHIQVGISREPWMIEGSAISPLLSDYTDTIFTLGANFDVGHWKIQGVIGSGIWEDRSVTKEENPAFPGKYSLDGGIAGVEIRYTM